MSEQTHQSDPRILSRRTLDADHRRLAGLLETGMSVLDVGCGTGAITVGIAGKVGPAGRVLGIDRDDSLLSIARREHGGVPNLEFQRADVLDLMIEPGFDIVTAARTLQWIGQPDRAVSAIGRAVKPGGRLVVLDYNHQRNSWSPDPPTEFQRFYQAFLNWRAANGWDNLMADHLADLFRSAGLVDIEVHTDNEGGGTEAAAIWIHTIQTLGLQLVTDGFLTGLELDSAEARYHDFIRTLLTRQTLNMKTVVGRRILGKRS